jgi:hypothetical protein
MYSSPIQTHTNSNPQKKYPKPTHKQPSPPLHGLSPMTPTQKKIKTNKKTHILSKLNRNEENRAESSKDQCKRKNNKKFTKCLDCIILLKFQCTASTTYIGLATWRLIKN